VLSGTSLGSRSTEISGPFWPTDASILRQPPYSVPAATEMVDTLSKCRTAARLVANASLTPRAVVSAVVMGTQSKPITPVRQRANWASAAIRSLRGRSGESSGRR
jgi:hypothetical protein